MDDFKTLFINNEFKKAISLCEDLLGFDVHSHFDTKSEEKLKNFHAWCRFMILQGLSVKAIEVFDLNFPCIDSIFDDSQFPLQIANLLEQRANLAFYVGSYVEGMKYVKKAIDWKKNELEKGGEGEHAVKPSDLYRSNIVLGKNLWKQGALFEALTAYIKALSYYFDPEKNRITHYSAGRVWCMIGQVYLDMNDPEFALKIFKHSDTVLKNSALADHHLYIGVTQINIAKAILLTLRKKVNEQKYSNHKIIEEVKEAERYLSNVRILFSKALGDKTAHRYKGTLLNALALLENTKLGFSYCFPDSSLDKVLDTYDKEISIRRKTFGEEVSHPTVAIAYNRSARAILSFLPKNNKEEGLNKALKFIGHALQELEERSLKPRLFETYYLKARACRKLFIHTQKREFILLFDAEKAIGDAIKVGHEIYQQNLKSKITIAFSQRLRQAHELALDILFLIWQKEGSQGLNGKIENNILSKMEGSRAVNFDFLTEQDKKAPLTKVLGFDELKELLEDFMLKGHKSDLDNKILHSALSAYGGKLKLSQEEEEVSFKLKGGEFDDFIAGSSVNLAKLWQYFEKSGNGVILSYIITDKAIYIACLFAENNEFLFLRFKEDKDPGKIITDLKNAALGIKRLFNRDYWDTDSGLSIPEASALSAGLCDKKVSYTGEGVFFKEEELLPNSQLFVYLTELYRMLFEKLEWEFQQKDVKRIYIIKDSVIHFLPFELLAPRRAGIENGFEVHDFKDLDYLITRYKISYHLSITLLYRRHLLEKSQKVDIIKIPKGYSNTPILCVASNYTSNSIGICFNDNIADMSKLNYVYDELEGISGSSPCLNKLFNAQITKENLFKKLENNQYKIIHLQMHTISSPLGTEFGIAFPIDNKMVVVNAKDIRENEKGERRNLSHIQLLFLISCRGGDAKTETNHHVPDSLTNAFIDIGVHNVLYSPFRTGSLDAAMVCRLFLQNLKEHQDDFVTALQQAKIKLLKGEYTDDDTIDPKNFAHPKFWAKILFIGNQLGGIE